MPLGLKPCCSVCKSTSSTMWKKGAQGEILCNNCTGKSPVGGGGGHGGPAGPSSMSSSHITLANNGGGKQ
ncbi:hypothetical protein CRUP_003158, partial [Coryphaenoides rupestris]